MGSSGYGSSSGFHSDQITGAQGVGNRGYSTQANYGQEMSGQGMSGMLARNAMPATLVAFGLGIGAGILLTNLFIEPPRRRWYEPKSAEKFGRQVLDSLTGVLPDSLTSCMRD